MPPSACVNMFTTNADLTDAQVIEGYHDHATCEQFHAELKQEQKNYRTNSHLG